MLNGYIRINLLFFFVLLVLASCKKDPCDDSDCGYVTDINYVSLLFTFEKDSLNGLGGESYSYYPFYSGKEAWVARPTIYKDRYSIPLTADSIHFYVEDSLNFRCNYEYKNSIIHSITVNDVMLCSGNCKHDSIYVIK